MLYYNTFTTSITLLYHYVFLAPLALKTLPTFAIINVINISCNPNLTEVFVQKYFNINLST